MHISRDLFTTAPEAEKHSGANSEGILRYLTFAGLAFLALMLTLP
jgi:hypothetical protein